MADGAGKCPDHTGHDPLKGVAQLTSIFEGGERSPATFQVRDRNSQLQRMMSELSASPGKLASLNTQLLGDMVLFLYQKSQQREVEFRDHIEASDREKRALKDDILHLQDDNTNLQQTVFHLQTEVEEKQSEVEGLSQSLHVKQQEVEELEERVAQLQAKIEPEVSNQVRPAPSDPNSGTQADEPPEYQEEEEHGPLDEVSAHKFFSTSQPPEYSRSTAFGAPPSSGAPCSVLFHPPPPYIDGGVEPPGYEEYPRRGDPPSHNFDPCFDPCLNPYAEPVNGLHARRLEALTKDIDRFDPNARGADIDIYLREVEYCLKDVPHATNHEKYRFIWKTGTAQSQTWEP